MYLAELYSLSIAEDSYDQGEIGELQIVTYSLSFKGNTPHSALKKIAKHFGLEPSDFEYDYGNLISGMLTNFDGSKATASEIAKWKQGKKRLWNTTIQVKLQVVRNATSAEYKKALGKNKNPRRRKRRNPQMTFSKVKIGGSFELNGSTWVKKSSRTAYIFGMPHRWFYFSNNDIVFTTRKEANKYERSQPTRYLNPRKRGRK